MPLSPWGAQSTLVSKGDLRSDSPNFARVYEGRNGDSRANRAQYCLDFEEVGRVPHIFGNFLKRHFQPSKELVIWTCELEVMAIQS